MLEGVGAKALIVGAPSNKPTTTRIQHTFIVVAFLLMLSLCLIVRKGKEKMIKEEEDCWRSALHFCG